MTESAFASIVLEFSLTAAPLVAAQDTPSAPVSAHTGWRERTCTSQLDRLLVRHVPIQHSGEQRRLRCS